MYRLLKRQNVKMANERSIGKEEEWPKPEWWVIAEHSRFFFSLSVFAEHQGDNPMFPGGTGVTLRENSDVTFKRTPVSMRVTDLPPRSSVNDNFQAWLCTWCSGAVLIEFMPFYLIHLRMLLGLHIKIKMEVGSRFFRWTFRETFLAKTLDVPPFTPDKEWREHRCYGTFVKGANGNLGNEREVLDIQEVNYVEKLGYVKKLNTNMDWKTDKELEKEMLNGQQLQGPQTPAEVYHILKQKGLLNTGGGACDQDSAIENSPLPLVLRGVQSAGCLRLSPITWGAVAAKMLRS
ncbi:hypothetical protein MG293_011391 [Ovis ammon polii]|uniref:Uncharacterized protein n=1 Tax=Ovis ammon polii TaxID=230172 RepID=A0AAD4Y844_OVIAM|nr:hypothetical protein MG293_011391 [Ovis ammon polii]